MSVPMIIHFTLLNSKNNLSSSYSALHWPQSPVKTSLALQWLIIVYQNLFMYSKSQLQSYPERKSSMKISYSRVSERTIDASRSLKEFQALEIESTLNETFDKNLGYSKAASTPIRAKIIQKKMKNMNRNDETKRNYLSKILINRMINTRLALKIFQALPIKIFKKGYTFDIARQIVFKTKINIETSILRSLIVAEERKNSHNNTRLHFERGQNIFVYPSQPKADQSNQKQLALLKLAELIKLPVKYAAQQFAKHSKQQLSIKRYLNKVCSNYAFSRKIAFLMFKVLPNAKQTGKKMKDLLRNKQLQIVQRILNKKYTKRVGLSLSYIKVFSWNIKFKQELVARQIITFSKLRKLQSLNVWKAELKKELPKQVVSYEEVSEQKVDAVRKIIARNYLKLWKHISKKIYMFNKVARRIGCYSKINQQKSFWRLLVNSRQRN